MYRHGLSQGLSPGIGCPAAVLANVSDSIPSYRPNLGRSLCTAAALGVVLGALAWFGALAGARHWRLDQLGHGVPLLWGGSALCLAVLLWGRSWRWAGVAAALVVACGFQVIPWFIAPSGGQGGDSGGESLRLYYANVLMLNEDVAGLREKIEQSSADIVALVEPDQEWLSALAPALSTYPHRIENPRNDMFGIALYSKRPLASAEVIELGIGQRRQAPALRARIQLNGAPLDLWVVHVWPPVSAAYSAERDEQLRELAGYLRESSGQSLVMGDLNTSMYASSYRRFERASGLQNARRGHGLLGTWPSHYPAWLRIPIDHMLVSKDLSVTHLQTLTTPGSDHLALVADIR